MDLEVGVVRTTKGDGAPVLREREARREEYQQWRASRRVITSSARPFAFSVHANDARLPASECCATRGGPAA